jgi:hypothetical protein
MGATASIIACYTVNLYYIRIEIMKAMRLILLIAIVFVCGVVNAQVLKLKPGQKFSYEAISDMNQKGQYRSKNYNYWKVNFVVTSHANGVYTLKASPELFLTRWADNIDDSKVPFEDQPLDFMAIAKKVMTMCSYNLTLNDSGNITKVTGIPQIKAAIMSKLKALNTPEGHQKHAELAKMIISDAYFIAQSSFFKRQGGQINRIAKTGLIKTYAFDTTEKSFSPQGVEVAIRHTQTKFNLISSDLNKEDHTFR